MRRQNFLSLILLDSPSTKDYCILLLPAKSDRALGRQSPKREQHSTAQHSIAAKGAKHGLDIACFIVLRRCRKYILQNIFNLEKFLLLDRNVFITAHAVSIEAQKLGNFINKINDQLQAILLRRAYVLYFTKLRSTA